MWLMDEVHELRRMASLLEESATMPGLAPAVRSAMTEKAMGFREEAHALESSATALHPTAGGPPWYAIALEEIGTKEVRGGENPRILEYFLATTYHASEDEIPWCSAFACWCMEEAGIASPERANARSWLDWGNPVPPDEVEQGDVVVLWRGSPEGTQGHVGFLVSRPGDRIHILGGNQSDSVRISDYPASQLLGYRRPA